MRHGAIPDVMREMTPLDGELWALWTARGPEAPERAHRSIKWRRRWHAAIEARNADYYARRKALGFRDGE